MLLQLFQIKFLARFVKMQHCKISTNLKENPINLPFEIFSVSITCDSLQASGVWGITGSQCPRSAGKWFLSVACSRRSVQNCYCGDEGMAVFYQTE